MDLELTLHKLTFENNLIQNKNIKNNHIEIENLLIDKIKDIENEIINNKYDFIVDIPYETKLIYRIVYNIQIFTFIKKNNIYEENLIMQYRNIKNEIRFILYKINYDIFFNNKYNKDIVKLNKYILTENEILYDVENLNINKYYKKKLFHLVKYKNNLKNNIINIKKNYMIIDDIFNKEINKSEKYKNIYNWFFVYFIKKENYDEFNNNIIIKDFLKNIS